LRHEVSQLLGAWTAAGIRVLVFKGFYLAEFVYPMPGERTYADIDLLIDPLRASDAARIARELGWRETWSAERTSTMLADDSQSRPEDYPGHEVLNLDFVELGGRIDVHRRVVHNRLPWTRVQERITRLAWRSARAIRWEGAEVDVLEPADAILIGLVMNRCWGSDDWNLKPSDYADFAAIVEAFGVTRQALLERAGVLGCKRTLELYLARCDPFQRILDLRAPTGRDRFLWGCAVLPERGHPGLELAVHRVLKKPREIVHLMRALPIVLRVLRGGSGSERDAPDPARSSEVHASDDLLSYREWQGVQQGARRALKLFGRDPDAADGVYVRVLYHALRARGLEVTLRGAHLEVAGKTVPIKSHALGRAEA
jgi:hypothetical protein